jgi:helicase
MLISDVKRIHPSLEEVCAIIEKEEGISELFPYQEECIQNLDNSLVLSIPTSGGKTLIAKLAALKNVLEGKGKVIYTCPLRAIASEKYDEFKKFERLGIKVALTMGDYDSDDPWLREYDIIITTNEKLDSLIRHKSSFIKDVSLLIADEIHLLDDVSRGPTLEIVITRLRRILRDIRIFALSATVPNSEEIASWLGAKLIYSDFRPVPLYEGIFFNGEIIFKGKEPEKVKVKGREDIALALDVIKRGKQAVIFVSSRKSAESTAKRAAEYIESCLSEGEKAMLSKISKEILSAIESPTKQCKLLSELVKKGVAFHHAGLVNAQRKLIEDSYRKNLIKLIVATPTLGAGVNLPNYRSICRDLIRYTDFEAISIPVREYKQWAGRSGRLGYDSEGEAVIIASYPDEFRKLWERYIEGEIEEVESKLSVEPILRSQILSLIATEIDSTEELLNFFKETFFFHQYKSLSGLKEKIEKIVKLLIKWQFIEEKEGELRATKLGKRVTQLYIDPLTAHNFIEFLKEFDSGRLDGELPILQAACYTIEMSPYPRIRRKEEGRVLSEYGSVKRIAELYGCEYEEEFLQALKLACCLKDWINEINEDMLLTNFSIPPGELRGRIERAKWLVYSMHEIAKVIKMKRERINEIKKMEIRIECGVKEELIPLVLLPGIGRIKSRRLYEYGIRNSVDIKSTKAEILYKLIGKATTENLLKFLGRSEI